MPLFLKVRMVQKIDTSSHVACYYTDLGPQGLMVPLEYNSHPLGKPERTWSD